MRQYPSTNKLYFLTSDVIYNPVNPDPKPMRQYPSTNKLYFQTSDIIRNPKNPVNPDPKPTPLQWIQIICENILCFINVSKSIIHLFAVKLHFIIGNPDGSHAVSNKIGNGTGLRHKSIHPQ